MRLQSNKIVSCALLSSFVSFAAPTLYADVTVGRIIPSANPTMQSMSVPGVSATDFNIVNAGNYAFASDDQSISFFDGQKWGAAQQIEKKGQIWEVEFSYPDSGKSADAWVLTSTKNLYHFDGSSWSKPASIKSILNLTENTDNTDIQTSNGYAFLFAETGKKSLGTSTVVFSIWSPLSHQWSKPTMLKNSYLVRYADEFAVAAYKDIAGTPTYTLLIYANASSQSPVPEFIQVKANGSYTSLSSPLLPKFNSQYSGEPRFFIDKSGSYILLNSSMDTTYLWYNHNSTASGWHATQFPVDSLDSDSLIAGQVASGVVCSDLDMGNNELGLSCVNTLADHPEWSNPITIEGADTSLSPDWFYTESNGAWVSYSTYTSSQEKTNVVFYNMSLEALDTTNFPAENLPQLKQLSDKTTLACASNNNSLDKLFYYDSNPADPTWKRITNSGSLRGCHISYNDTMLTNFGGDQDTWLFNTRFSTKNCKKLERLHYGYMKANSFCAKNSE